MRIKPNSQYYNYTMINEILTSGLVISQHACKPKTYVSLLGWNPDPEDNGNPEGEAEQGNLIKGFVN